MHEMALWGGGGGGFAGPGCLLCALALRGLLGLEDKRLDECGSVNSLAQ